MVDNDKDTNLNSILAEIKENNFVSSFEFLEERNLIGTKAILAIKQVINLMKIIRLSFQLEETKRLT